MKDSYRLTSSFGQRLSLLPLCLFLAVIGGAVLALINQLDGHFFRQTFTNKELYFALAMSLGTSLLSLCFAVLIALPSAWVMSRITLPFQRVIDTLLDLPMVLPPLVIGLSLLLLFNAQGYVGQWFPFIRELIFSPLGIIVAQTYIAASILLRNARGAFSSIDPGYCLAAYNLGLSPFNTLCRIELPMCLKPLLCGAILAWSRAIGEFGATLMLAGATRFKTETLPMAIYLNIASGDFELAIGAAIWLLLISALLLLLLRVINRNI
ncbi:ABC transporter permease [Necropsobacter massiliensis]|uniref:ABC transporter permease n=1 Tax=Necropsobacter massiliensis TaxID=1400001 RepID=UPI000595C572|nr:ABC transporter permease [Necropsobacter massiliensis]